MVRILDSDDIRTMAAKIYFHFEMLEMCEIRGWVRSDVGLASKGELVLSEIARMDNEEHVRDTKAGKRARVNVPMRGNVIGGPIAHKIFKWEKTISDNEPRYRIWRVQ